MDVTAMKRRLSLVAIVAISLFAAACTGADTDTAVTTPDDSALTTVAQTTSPPDSDPAATDPAVSTTDNTPDSVPQGAGVGDSLYPLAGNGGYDVTNYVIDLTVDVASNVISGTTTITATSTEELSEFNLDFSGLEVEGISVNDGAADHKRDGDELTVVVATAIAADTEFEVAVDYSGTPVPINDPGVPFTTLGWQQISGMVYVASEPTGAKSWFPSNNHPTDKATFEFKITTASDLTVVANGVQQGIEPADAGNSTTTWLMDDPMATYLASVYIGDFELRESITSDGLRIRNYFPPADADRLEEDFAITADVIDFYEEIFGADYPFDEYGSLVLPFPTGFALENQTISLHGLDATDSDTIAHEIMHQWAGNSVSVGQWQDIWMLEGFATYLAYMYHEDRGLVAGIEPSFMYAVLEDSGVAGPAEVEIGDLFGLSVYFRGGLALHALRSEVGDEMFIEVLRAYYSANAGGDVTTAEFQSIVSRTAGDDARATLDAWLFGTELPAFPG